MRLNGNDGKEISIILICSERRNFGSNILSKLFSIGIYNALIGNDRSMDNLCRLINRPRTKKEAKLYDLKYVSLRYFNAAGDDPDCEIGEDHNPETRIIPLTLAAASGIRKDITIFGSDYPTPDGTCVRDYVHVNDIAQAHIKAFEYLLDGGESDSFNIGNGKGFSVKEVIQTCKKVTGRDFPVIMGDKRPGDPAILVADSTKIREKLNWNPKFDNLEDIVETAWNWHKKLHSIK